jgi:hypothetical protein
MSFSTVKRIPGAFRMYRSAGWHTYAVGLCKQAPRRGAPLLYQQAEQNPGVLSQLGHHQGVQRYFHCAGGGSESVRYKGIVGLMLDNRWYRIVPKLQWTRS